jgi:hypothetical protein
MCNGEDPHQRLSWDLYQNTAVLASTAGHNVRIGEKLFISLKQDGDSILRLAIETLKDRPKSDVDATKVQKVFEVSLQRDPNSRASSFNEIIDIWGPKEYQASLPSVLFIALCLFIRAEIVTVFQSQNH